MRTFFGVLFAAGALVTGAAYGAELQPAQGVSIALGQVTGVAYYTVEEDGYRVITTVASGESATPVRFITTLTAGQKTVVSVPREAGLSALEVQIARVGDRVHVTTGQQLSSMD